MGKRYWIIGGASVDNLGFYRSLRPKMDDVVLCADKGYDNAVQFGFTPTAIIGDMDSCISTIDPRCKRIVAPMEKNETDMHLAVDYAIEDGAEEIILLCAFGGAWGHTFGNLSLLRRIAYRGIDSMLLTPTARISVLRNSDTRVPKENSEVLSVIPLSAKVEGVTIRQTKYELFDETLYSVETRGINNEFTPLDALISVKDGELLIIAE